MYSQLFYLNILIDDHHQGDFSFLNIEIFVKFSNQIKKTSRIYTFYKKIPIFPHFQLGKFVYYPLPLRPLGGPQKKETKEKNGLNLESPKRESVPKLMVRQLAGN